MSKVMLFLFFSFLTQLFSATYTVNGNAYLEGGTDHSGIKVFFQRVAPDASYSYTVYTNSAGYYSQIVENGWYNIEFTKTGYDKITLTNIALYSTQTIGIQTLLTQGLEGSIEGILHAGVYNVTDTLKVLDGDSLIIEPGVVMNFNTNAILLINGYLKAEGTETDSIFFNECKGVYVNDPLLYNPKIKMDYCSIKRTGGTTISIQHNPEYSSAEFSVTNSYIKVSYISLFAHPGVNFDNVLFEGTGNNTCFVFNMHDSKLILRNCTITNFSTGIFMQNGMVDECLIENSYMNTNGYGIISWTGGLIKISNSTIIAKNIGGEDYYSTVYPYSCDLEIYNSTIIAKGKSAVSSGKIVKMFNSIIDAYTYGIKSSGVQPVNIVNSNVRGQTGNFYNCGPILGVIVTTNANGDPCDGYFNTSMDPLFLDEWNSDFMLTENSPCIDAGTNSISDYVFPSKDILGNTRIWDGDGNGTSIVDMGAYEYGSSIPVSIEDVSEEIQGCQLYQNYPNPFNPVTTISYALPQASNVELNVYNLQGQLVQSLVNGRLSKGMHKAEFNGAELTSGLYIYNLKVENKVVSSKKMMLLK